MMGEEITVSQANALTIERGQTISKSYLARAVSLGKINGRRVSDPTGRAYWLVDKADLERYLASERHPGVKKGQSWSEKRKQKTPGAQASSAIQAAEALPVQPVAPTRPAPAVESLKRSPPAPQETIIDREGAHITIDPLLPDLQRWMHAEAIKGDVTAWCDIRPYPDAHWPGAYVVDYYYDRKDRNKKGAMGRNQEERAQALMHLLMDQLTESLQAAGWQTLTKTPSGQTLWHYRPGQQKEA